MLATNRLINRFCYMFFYGKCFRDTDHKIDEKLYYSRAKSDNLQI